MQIGCQSVNILEAIQKYLREKFAKESVIRHVGQCGITMYCQHYLKALERPDFVVAQYRSAPG
jgi:hypothetical protein